MIDLVSLPPQIKECMSIYKQYYMTKFTGRQLHWKLNQGQAEIRARIGNNGTKKYEMTVSTYQMCILMLFNDAGPQGLPLSQICEILKLD